MSTYTANIQKGGALIEDSRRLVEVWDLASSPEANLERIASANILGKTTRRRLDDVLMRVLRPRLVAPGSEVIAAMKQLRCHPPAFREALFFEAAADDKLLAAFSEGPLCEWYEGGRTGVAVADVTNWLAAETARRRAPEWSPTVRTKVARGLLAALRDFGVLEGAARKTFATPGMSVAGFCYAAYRLHETGLSSRGIVDSAVWRRWLLTGEHVADLFRQASRNGVLSFVSVGSSVRIEWHFDNLEEVVRAAV
jgi:hypothetical protein